MAQIANQSAPLNKLAANQLLTMIKELITCPTISVLPLIRQNNPL